MHTCVCVRVRVLQMDKDLPFLATKVLLGPHGVAKIMPVGELDSFEKAAYEVMKPQLQQEIQKGLTFVKSPPPPATPAPSAAAPAAA